MKPFQSLNRMHTNSRKWDLERGSFDEDFLPFSIADSDYPSPKPIIEALKRRVEHGAFGYNYVDESYEKAVSDWFLRRYHFTVLKNEFFPAPGVVAALYLAVKGLTKKQDKVVIQTPVYPRFFDVIHDNHRELIDNKLVNINGRYTMDYFGLEEAFKQGAKMFILCNPHNPAGRVWTKHEIEQVLALCKKYKVTLVSDEIHADIILKGHEFTSLGHYLDDYDQLMVCTSPNKTFNIAGLHLSNIVIRNPKMREFIHHELRVSHNCTPNLFATLACQVAYTECDDWVEAQNRHIERNFKLLYRFVKEHIPQMGITKAEGTYLAWLDMSFLKRDSTYITEKVLEYGIALSDGKKFDPDSTQFVRMNLACSKAQLQAGLERFLNFILDELQA